MIDITEDERKEIENFIKQHSNYDKSYLELHLARYIQTIWHMPHGKYLLDGKYSRALELGTTYVFPKWMIERLGFKQVDVTDFLEDLAARSSEYIIETHHGPVAGQRFNINLEIDEIPTSDATYDLVLCLEVIEHLELDPMFMLSEINRVLKPGGCLYLSTPNSISGRNVFKILHGYAPHFFMKYNKQGKLYRHNIEYAPHQVLALAKAAGFSVRKFWTADTFEDTVPEALKILDENGYSTEYRGDNIFGIFQKETGVIERYPSDIYF
jgi:SAM-dependent methyltransferase